jgi:hypothetical protein
MIMSASNSQDTPQLAGAQGDRLERGASMSPQPSVPGDQSVPDLVADTIAVLMNAAGDGAEQAYQDRLEQLRGDDEAVVAAVRATYDALPEQEYLERWGAVQLLTDLRLPGSVEVLKSVLSQPIPPERSPDPAHGVSTVGEEVMIRTTAVEALARLAAAGDQAAVDTLRDNVSHEAFSVRRAAVQAIGELGDEQQVAYVRRTLGEEQASLLLGIRRLDVREVPQAEGGRFLKPDQPPPPPDSTS